MPYLTLENVRTRITLNYFYLECCFLHTLLNSVHIWIQVLLDMMFSLFCSTNSYSSYPLIYHIITFVLLHGFKSSSLPVPFFHVMLSTEFTYQHNYTLSFVTKRFSSCFILIWESNIFLLRDLCKDFFRKWSSLDNSCFSIETVSGGITNLCEFCCLKLSYLSFVSCYSCQQ